MRAIFNSGPLIHLSWIDRLHLLHELFEEILVPNEVRNEVLRAGPDVLGAEVIHRAFTSGWLRAVAVRDLAAVASLSTIVDPGEAEAIVLMQEENVNLLLLDDRPARIEARRRQLPFTGTIGVLQRARQRGLIQAAHPLLIHLRELGFRIGDELLEQVGDEER